MWAMSNVCVSPARPLHCHILIANPTITPRKSLSQLALVVSATNPQPQRHENDNNAIGGLGRTILTAIQSNPKPANSIPTPDDREDQISGSDVLWAMRKVADKKKKKNKKKKSGTDRESLLSSVGGRREEFGGGDGDYSGESDIRPLIVKSEWGRKLDELENRLKELSQTK